MCILYWSTMALPRKLYSRLQEPLSLPAAGAHGALPVDAPAVVVDFFKLEMTLSHGSSSLKQ